MTQPPFAVRGWRGERPAPLGGIAAGSFALLLFVVLTGAVFLRVGLAGAAGARSVPAGAIFGALLLALAAAAGWRPARPRLTDAAVGFAGAGVLLAVPALRHLAAPGAALGRPAAGWLVVVALVAVAEEAFLRGALWAALARRGELVALAGTTLAFALLHVPLYGMQVLPLDLAVGVLLGGLRMLTGRAAAPAWAHTVADLAGWWLR